MTSYGKLVGSITLGLAAISASAQEARTNFGLLTCTVGKGQEQRVAVKGPTQAVTCGFKPTTAGADEDYTGTIHHSGTGKEVLTGKMVLMWVVNAPANTKASRGWLEQSYIADPPTARLFVGQTNRAIVLQLETDANLPGDKAISVTKVDLKLTATPTSTAQRAPK